MTGLFAIMRKEWRSYFVTPAAYIVLAVFAVIAGFFFYSMLAFMWYPAWAAAVSARRRNWTCIPCCCSRCF